MRIKETVERLERDADRAREELLKLRAEVEELKAAVGRTVTLSATEIGTVPEAPKTARKRTAKKTEEAAGK